MWPYQFGAIPRDRTQNNERETPGIDRLSGRYDRSERLEDGLCCFVWVGECGAVQQEFSGCQHAVIGDFGLCMGDACAYCRDSFIRVRGCEGSGGLEQDGIEGENGRFGKVRCDDPCPMFR